MPRLSSLFAGLVALAVIAPLACYDLNDIRRGGKGESCARTDDCQSPLVCIDLTCVEPGGSGGGGTIITGEGGSGAAAGGTTSSLGGSGGTTSTETGGAGGGGSGGGTGGLDPAVCKSCIHAACAPELAACDDGCYAIDACVQMLCSYLSTIGAAQEEGLCQQHCQTPHIGSKQEHIDVVLCSIGAWPDCDACSSYPFDYNDCVGKASAGACKTTFDACNASNDCVQYRECVGSCATLADCLSCNDTPEGLAGEALLFEYNQCLSAQCLSEAWLP